MGSYLKINPIRLGKFNNAEYTNIMSQTLSYAVNERKEFEKDKLDQANNQ